MTLFTSAREKQLWLLAFLVWDAIFLTLFIGQPLLRLFGDQEIQALIFVAGMILVGTVILLHARKAQPTKLELSIWLGILAVYLMLFLRLGLPERTHLFEYSILAIFIHKALLEREIQGKHVPSPALLAIGMAFSIGVLDEGLQYFMPDRVFDPLDILFNGFAVTMAIGVRVILS